LLVYENENDKNDSFKNFLKNAGRRIFSTFNPTKYVEMVERIELYDNVSVYAIKLPYYCNRLEGKVKKKFENFLKNYCENNNISICMIPRQGFDITGLNNAAECNTLKRLISKCLINSVMEAILNYIGLDMGSVDICIIQGDSNKELHALVQLFSHSAKYITLLVKDRAAIEDEINDIYVESGLSVWVTNDYRSALGNADIVINLGDLNGYGIRTGISRKLVILNYGNVDVRVLPAGSMVINGIEIGLQKEIVSKLSKSIFNCYTESEIAEIILLHRIKAYSNVSSLAFNSESMKELQDQFTKDGFFVKELLGLHGPITKAFTLCR
jgi:hypothetical protein